MIPRIKHSRSQLHSHLNEYKDGPISFFVSSDTYPELVTLAFPNLIKKAPNGWSYKKMAYLWFPPDTVDDAELDTLRAWQERFSCYVLIGLNEYIEPYFSSELDFCMALDFNRVPQSEKRTVYGEAVYQVKYLSSSQFLPTLGNALVDAIADLPIPHHHKGSYCISCIPAPPGQLTIPRRLAKGMAGKLSVDFVDAELRCPKASLKNATVEAKIPMWQSLYDQGCVELSGSVEGRLVVVVDDLYQSGATMWAYAGFLKSQGAAHVIGLPCVKSLRDSDNQ